MLWWQTYFLSTQFLWLLQVVYEIMKRTYENVLTNVKIAGSYCIIKQKMGLCPSVAETSIFKQRKREMYCRIIIKNAASSRQCFTFPLPNYCFSFHFCNM